MAAAKRPPAQVWIVLDCGTPKQAYRTKREAVSELEFEEELTVAGPYVLAERVRQR